MRRIIIITALCGVILVGSVIGGSYMIVCAIRQTADRQVEAIEQAADREAAANQAAKSEGSSGGGLRGGTWSGDPNPVWGSQPYQTLREVEAAMRREAEERRRSQ